MQAIFCKTCPSMPKVTSAPLRYPSYIRLPRVSCYSQRGPYPWAIISDPIRAFLFVLVRDPGNFSGSKMEEKLLAKCKELGFTSSWNSPRKTVQEGCSYTPEPSKTATEEATGGSSLSAAVELRGGASGFGAPLHASCKVDKAPGMFTSGNHVRN